LPERTVHSAEATVKWQNSTETVQDRMSSSPTSGGSLTWARPPGKFAGSLFPLFPKSGSRMIVAPDWWDSRGRLSLHTGAMGSGCKSRAAAQL